MRGGSSTFPTSPSPLSSLSQDRCTLFAITQISVKNETTPISLTVNGEKAACPACRCTRNRVFTTLSKTDIPPITYGKDRRGNRRWPIEALDRKRRWTSRQRARGARCKRQEPRAKHQIHCRDKPRDRISSASSETKEIVNVRVALAQHATCST